MKRLIPSPSTILSFALGGLLLGSHLVFGFTEPAQLPAEGNVLPPLDTSATGQAKAGGLIVNTGGAPVGFIVDKGSVGIGTNNPGGTLDVQGSSANPIGVFNQLGSGDIAEFLDSDIQVFNIKKGGIVCIRQNCSESWLDTTPVVRSIQSTPNNSDFTSGGDVVIASNTSLSGYHFYNSLVIQAGVTVTVPPGSGGLALIARKSIVINGTINAEGAGIGYNGHQAGGGAYVCSFQEDGSCSASYVAGGAAVYDGIVVVNGGTDVYAPVSVSSHWVWASRHALLGGAKGGSSTDSGGAGGGDIWLSANSITLNSGSSISARGQNGEGITWLTCSSTGCSGPNGSGGGGGGNIIIEAINYTNNGGTLTNTGGLNVSGYGTNGANGDLIIATY